MNIWKSWKASSSAERNMSSRQTSAACWSTDSAKQQNIILLSKIKNHNLWRESKWNYFRYQSILMLNTPSQNTCLIRWRILGRFCRRSAFLLNSWDRCCQVRNLSSAAVMSGSQNQQSLHRPLISEAPVSSMQARKSVTVHLSVAVRLLAKTA